MLDYHAHVAVARELRASVGAVFAGDPALAAQVDDLCAAVDDDPDAALLGACLDHVVAQADSDGTELALLEQAADLWSRGRELYDELGRIRQELEGALGDPTAPGAVSLLQSGIGRLDGLRTGALQVSHEAETLKQAIAPLPHLDRHPRQSDTPSADWSWRDAFLGRRTDALVRAVFAHAGTPRTRAFAFGALAGYAGNVAGAAYLGCVTGGPRRSHRYRNRLARNAVGAALHGAFATPPPAELADRLDFTGPGGVASLPADVADVLRDALADAYPSRPPPDLDLGLQRVVRQLRLLDAFARPPLPQAPPLALAGSGAATGGLSILSATGELTPPGGGVGLDPDFEPTDVGVGDSHKTGGDACVAILVAIITIGIALLIYCIGKWSLDKECEVSDFVDEFQGSEEPDPTAPTGVGQQELTAMAKPEAAAHVVQELFNLQLLLWQGFDVALSYLAVSGLVYPDDLLLPSPLYQQFLRTPERGEWPHREEAAPEDTFHLDPASPIEAPDAGPPFPAGHAPASFVVSWSSGHSAGPVAAILLGQILNDEEGTNLDLDADRGFLHACWDVAPGTSVQDPVLDVELLAYGAE